MLIAASDSCSACWMRGHAFSHVALRSGAAVSGAAGNGCNVTVLSSARAPAAAAARVITNNIRIKNACM